MQMEQFTRECLEIDNEKTNGQKSLLGVSTTMDKVYERAARLVKRTLDVEGAIVLDVSHSEVLETSGSEGAVSVVIHRADAEGGMGNQTLSALEFTQLNEFFTKYPDGRISETVVPPCLRAFLPSHIQYALSKLLLRYHWGCLCTDVCCCALKRFPYSTWTSGLLRSYARTTLRNTRSAM